MSTTRKQRLYEGFTMFRFIAGIITGTAITIIGWQSAIMAVIGLVKKIIENNT